MIVLQFCSVGMSRASAVVPVTIALTQMIALLVITAASAQDSYRVGVSSVDITPDYPIRLNGFGNRQYPKIINNILIGTPMN